MAEHRVYESDEPCWRCGGALVELRPPLRGWRFYCPQCEHMTAPRAELDAAVAAKPADAIGVVSAWP